MGSSFRLSDNYSSGSEAFWVPGLMPECLRGDRLVAARLLPLLFDAVGKLLCEFEGLKVSNGRYRGLVEP